MDFATYLYLLKALHLLLKCREMCIYVSYFAIQSAFILKLVIIATQRSSSFILTAQCVWVPFFVSTCLQSFHKKNEVSKIPSFTFSCAHTHASFSRAVLSSKNNSVSHIYNVNFLAAATLSRNKQVKLM